jgi:hypothetical protein
LGRLIRARTPNDFGKKSATQGSSLLKDTLWEGLNNYNDPRWDPIFAFAGEQGIPLTGVCDIAIRALRGPGGRCSTIPAR